MCVAGLNVSTQPCRHRWYSQIRACEPNVTLANCEGKLKLEGWEIRNEHCPWCDGNDQILQGSTHRLFGSMSSGSSATSSPTSPALPATRAHRSGSAGTISMLSRHSSTASIESEQSLRSREMNDRLLTYLTAHPHEVLPSARRNYPSSPASPVDERPLSDTASIRIASSFFGNGLKRSVRLSKAIFKG